MRLARTPVAGTPATPGSRADRDRGAGRVRIGLRRRLLLRRQGRLDGRLRQPDPIMIDGIVTTPTRTLLAYEFLEKVAVVRQSCAGGIDAAYDELRRLDAQLGDLDRRLALVLAKLARLVAAKPPADGRPERHLGERDRPEELVRIRRARDHAKEVATLTAERTALERERRAARQRRERVRAHVQALRRHAVEAQNRFEATFYRERAVYDQALLRRHPQAALVRPMLDGSLPPVPRWQYAATGRDQREGRR